jgi:2-polyprenyl-3-methyl-5-hydroxy-6-metoxy-1,4-benzoquinol methylase
MNRAMFLKEMGSAWLPKIPDVHRRLRSDPPARVADVGMGAGWSSIAIAKSYPKVLVDGFDLDQPSVEMARRNAREAGIDNRVSFQVRDAADPKLARRYDLVAAFECIHDMADPVSALKAMKHLAGTTGTVVVVDERVGESFSTTKNDVDWMMYGWSILHCLPVGMADKPSAETGAVMRPNTLRSYARESGFHDVEILPIENYFFRFYRLIP